VRRLLARRRRQPRLELGDAVIRLQEPCFQPLDIFLLMRQRLGQIINHALLLRDERFQRIEAIVCHGGEFLQNLGPGATAGNGHELCIARPERRVQRFGQRRVGGVRGGIEIGGCEVAPGRL